jgi:type II secretory pathway component PulF
MLFAKQFSSGTLSQVCRMLRTGLDAGLPIVRVFRQQAERGPYVARPMLNRVAERLADGDSLADALEPERGLLPPLFVSMLAVGEETGSLGLTLRELEEYFDQMQQLRRLFIQQISWPAFQLVAAIGVITIMLLVMGALNIKMDPLGKHIGVGPLAAMKWLSLVFIVGVIIYLIYTGTTRQLRFLAPVERFTLALPGVGGALRAVLLSRFCLGAKLALGAGISTKRALQLSFEAAGSSLYRQAFDHAKVGIKRGESVHEVLSRCSIFPQDFLDVVIVGEEAGSLPETLGKQAVNYQEDAAMRLKLLTRFGSMGVYFLVAALLIVLIFSIFGTYIGEIEKAAK